MSVSRTERERLTREAEILSVAEQLFISKGFENTTMDEIAKSAEFTKRTVYQYFGSKENLFYGVILSGVKRLFSYIDESISTERNGFEKLTDIRQALYRYIKEYPDLYRLMSYTQFIKSDSAIQNLLELSQYNNRLFILFGQIVEEGMKDGSIRADLTMPVGIIALFFITTGFFGRVSEAGESYASMHHISTEELIETAFGMLDKLLST